MLRSLHTMNITLRVQCTVPSLAPGVCTVSPCPLSPSLCTALPPLATPSSTLHLPAPPTRHTLSCLRIWKILFSPWICPSSNSYLIFRTLLRPRFLQEAFSFSQMRSGTACHSTPYSLFKEFISAALNPL
ncbi:hypothetical protein HJG60_009955 [Phyllostomus discolor]|uniref:Uncharacterized protein n=1 Tax=Phyllostomus discolor TaxID=89673 RepID=A0A834B3T5_9CHIR|nr:hypothetical protein HJG60_009955 [Phyllostomus discolor]